MHQHKLSRVRVCRNIIGVKILDFKVIDFDRTLEQFMLNLLNNDILTVAENKNISRTKWDCACPAFLWNIERMGRGWFYRFAVYLYFNKLIRFVYKCSYNFFICNLSGFRVCRKNTVALFDIFNCSASVRRLDLRSRNETDIAAFSGGIGSANRGSYLCCCREYSFCFSYASALPPMTKSRTKFVPSFAVSSMQIFLPLFRQLRL